MERCIETQGERIDSHPGWAAMGSPKAIEREVSSSTWPSWGRRLQGCGRTSVALVKLSRPQLELDTFPLSNATLE
jgi:hypothetical protein